MKPAARVQAAIELLDLIIDGARNNGSPADMLARNFFRERRYMGSGDRRAVREIAYRALRRFGETPATGRAAMLGLTVEDAELAALFDGSNYGPPAIGKSEFPAIGPVIPHWLESRIYAELDEAERLALLERAELDIRWHPNKTDRAMITAAWPDAQFHDALPFAARLPSGTALDAHELWQSGAIEVQDWGSQAIVEACLDGETPDLVIDLCAGAGGKTLALAAQLPDSTRIIASDTNRQRLSALEPRRTRAGTQNIESILLDPRKELDALQAFTGKADIVLVDAPCSGTGTWRRNPETRWRLTGERLERLIEEQSRLMHIASELVKPGGILVYAVCSLLEEEGTSQVAASLSDRALWNIACDDVKIGRKTAFNDGSTAGVILTPMHDGTDGFFFTRARKTC